MSALPPTERLAHCASELQCVTRSLDPLLSGIAKKQVCEIGAARDNAVDIGEQLG
jgi:hypothetical protein